MAMNAAIPSHAFLAAFLPVARASLQLNQPTRRIPLLQRLSASLIPAAFIPIPQLIDTIWEGILKAVPKKKTSHMKKRHRFMAGKALKDVTSLNTCSSCGRVKRAHVLCPYCVKSIKQWFGTKLGINEKILEEERAVAAGLKKELHLIGRDRLKDRPRMLEARHAKRVELEAAREGTRAQRAEEDSSERSDPA